MIPRAWNIAVREYASFFRVPLGWIVIALFLVFAGLLFGSLIVVPGQPATMRPFFKWLFWLLLIIAPAITMRLFSDEYRNGTIEPLLTSPVTEAVVVIGKYLGAVLFMLTLLAPTVVYVVILSMLARIDLGPIVAGYLGNILLGMLYLAIGGFVSSLTANQPLAFLGTFFGLFIIEMLSLAVAPSAPPAIRTFLYAISVDDRMADFARGLVDTSHIVFFLAGSFWFLAMTAIALETRRWR